MKYREYGKGPLILLAVHETERIAARTCVFFSEANGCSCCKSRRALNASKVLPLTRNGTNVMVHCLRCNVLPALYR